MGLPSHSLTRVLKGDHTVTLWGDTLAFMGAVFVVGYLVSGRILRKWMPIFLYAFPVTLIGALLLIPASYAVEMIFCLRRLWLDFN